MSIEEIQNLIHEAMAVDLEHGVAWMNDEAWAEFNKTYPELFKALGKIMDIETDELEDDVIQH